jgi:hypothetical protein
VNVRFNSSNQRGGIYVNGTSGQPFFGQNLTFSSGSTFNYDKTAGAWAIGDAGGSNSLNFYWAASGTAGTAAMDLSTNTKRVGFYDATGWNLSTGLAVTGAVSGSAPSAGATTFTATSNGVSGINHPLYTFQRSGGAVAGEITYEGVGATMNLWTTTAHNLVLGYNRTAIAAISSTGLAVTGALSTTGSATIGDATTTTASRLTLDGLGTAGNVPMIRFKSAGVQKAFFGLSGGFLGTTATDALVGTDAAGASIVFHPGDSGVERARIDSSGNLRVGVTSVAYNTERLTVFKSGNAESAAFVNEAGANNNTVAVSNRATSGDNKFMVFATESSDTTRGAISYNRGTGLVVYGTTSDYRSKDILGPVVDSGALIDAVPVYMGKMKGAALERPMFIAHETPAYAHTGEKDAVDLEGNPVYQQIDNSTLVPVLWAEIQSLRQRVAALETSN